ncbi:MAG: TetR/AcrR family transcriptional regulator [Gaiellaceae bacterium]
MSSTTDTRKKRSDGERSRATILDAAARLATVEGLEGLSIGRLADHIGMSKSGLYAHFGSKEELQLATVETAGRIFVEEVVRPTRSATGPTARVHALTDSFLSYLERKVFPGGCFFASAVAELDTHPGLVKERLAEFQRAWLEKLEELLREGQEQGELDAAEDPAQLAFEVHALLGMANTAFQLHGDPGSMQRARVGIRRRLELARPA